MNGLMGKFSKPGHAMVDLCAGTLEMGLMDIELSRHFNLIGCGRYSECLHNLRLLVVEMLTRQTVGENFDITALEEEKTQRRCLCSR